jgi:hypothetical protein
MRAKLLLGALWFVSAATAAAADFAPSEYLDERTGATVTVTREALVFAIERSILAANARDYVTLTAVEVDRSGQLQVYLIGYFWSTIDRRAGHALADLAQRPIELSADGRVIRLVRAAVFPKDLLDGKRLLAPQSSHVESAAFVVSREILRYLAASKHLSLAFALDSQDADPQSDAALDAERDIYQPWGNGQQALAAFVAQSSGFHQP